MSLKSSIWLNEAIWFEDFWIRKDLRVPQNQPQIAPNLVNENKTNELRPKRKSCNEILQEKWDILISIGSLLRLYSVAQLLL